MNLGLLGAQEELVFERIKYIVLLIQYGEPTVSKIPKIEKKSPDVYFLHISNEMVQVRAIKKTVVNRLSQSHELTTEQILKHSIVAEDYPFENISRFDKKSHLYQSALHYLFAIYDYSPNSERNKFFVVFRILNESIMNQLYEEANLKLKQQKDYLKKSVTNFIGIQQNFRKIVEKILVSSPAKRFILNRIMGKLGQKKLTLQVKQMKMIMYALMGNHPEMQNLLRKQKIESYDIQKRKYDDALRQDASTNVVQIIEPSKSQIEQRYSEKRKMDGIIVRKANQKQQKDPTNANKIQQQLYLNKIPHRSQLEIDEFIGIRNSVQRMQIEERPIRQLPVSYKGEKVKIPVKDYSIIGKEVEWIRRQQIGVNQSLDRCQMIIVQIIKFMYQLMKVNCQHKVAKSLEQGPMQRVLECLKDVLTECEHKPEDKKSLENKHIMQLIKLGNKNYLQYRKNSSKFY